MKRYLTILSSVEDLPPDAAAAALIAAFDVADRSEARLLAAACAGTLERLAPARGLSPSVSGTRGIGAARRALAPWAFLRPFARSGTSDPKFPSASIPHLRRALLRAIAAIWSCLPDDARREIAAVTADGWADALATIPPPAADSARRNILALAAEVRQPSLAAALAAMLSDPRAALALEAERLLMDLAHRAADPATTLSAAQAATVRSAITKAFADSEAHGLRGVYLSSHALLSPDTIARARRRAVSISAGTQSPAADPLAAWFVDRPAPELGASIRASATPLSRRRAWEWLAIKDLAAACAARLRAGATAAEHDAVLSRWHLGLRPARGRAAREILRGRDTGTWLPNNREAAGLDVNARAGAARLAKLTRTPTPSPSAAVPGRSMDWALVDPDASVRLLASLNAGGTDIADYAFDRDANVARSAALAWSDAALRVGGRCILPRNSEAAAARLEITLAMCASPHAAVRAIGTQDARFADLFDGRSASSRVNAWRALQHDRPAFIDVVRSAAERAEAAHDADARQALLALIRRLDLSADFTDVLNAWAAQAATAAAQSETARAGATALTLLSSLTTSQLGEARGTLDSCLSAADTRVRANAVETIMLRVRRGLEAAPVVVVNSLLELKNDASHRVRANTIRGIVSAFRESTPATDARGPAVSARPQTASLAETKGTLAATGREELERMLRDERPLHRVAAVWAISRERWLARVEPSLRSRLGTLSRDDHDANVRRRAADIQRLIGEPAQAVPSHTLALSGTAA